MAGEKFDLVKTTLINLIDLLNEKDRMKVIMFSNEAHTINILDNLTPSKKAALKEQISEQAAGGGTSISSGMKLAF